MHSPTTSPTGTPPSRRRRSKILPTFSQSQVRRFAQNERYYIELTLMYNSPHYQLSIINYPLKKMLDKIIEIIMTILPFLGNRKKRKAIAQDVKEFSELVKDQYTFLMEQLEKVLKDYFDLSARVKEMHTEIFSLREQLAQAATLQCVNKECLQRTQSEASISEA